MSAFDNKQRNREKKTVIAVGSIFIYKGTCILI